jgi:hypothetical protein
MIGPGRPRPWRGGRDVFGPDGSYQGRIERGRGDTLERFGADGSYQGRINRGRDGWDAYGPDGSYQGRISGQGKRGLPPVISGQDAR